MDQGISGELSGVDRLHGFELLHPLHQSGSLVPVDCVGWAGVV